MKRVEETSLSRIWDHINSGNNFGVVSAFRKEYSMEVNNKKHEELKKMVMSNNLGYIEQKSGYSYKDSDTGEVVNAEEKSVFIPFCPKNVILTLGRKFFQESVLYKDASGFYLIYTDKNRFGKIDMTFKTKDNVFTMNKEDIKFAYSQLIKGNKNNTNVKFTYIAEKYVPTMTEGYKALKSRELPETCWVPISF